jgi:uncharacterized membrane protein YkoI
MKNTLPLILTVACAASAQADIGFPAAVTGCRAAVPQGTLLAVEIRERNNVLVYEGDMYDQAVTINWDPRLNMTTGALIAIDVDSPDQSSLSTIQWIMANLESATLDFADAIDAAAGSSSSSGLQKIQFDREEGILAFQLEYFDLSKIYVDAVTGGIIPHHSSGDDFEETLPPAQFNACLAAADAAVGAGWTAFEGESEDESSSSMTPANRVEVRYFETKGTGVRQVTVAVDGTVLSNVEYTPTASQASRIAAIRALVSSLAVSMSSAVDTAVVNYPAATVHEAELKVEQGALKWKVELITAALVEIDVWVDATTPAFLYATAAANTLPSDLNEDGLVDGSDLVQLFALWGVANPVIDMDGDTFVGGAELAGVLSRWTAQ